MNVGTILLIGALVSLAASSAGAVYVVRRSRIVQSEELQRALWRAWKDAQ